MLFTTEETKIVADELVRFNEDLIEMKGKMANWSEEEINASFEVTVVEGMVNKELNEKMDIALKVVKNENAQIDAIDQEMKRLRELKEEKVHVREKVKIQMQTALELAGKKKLQSLAGTVGIRKNPMAVIITDEEEISEEFITIQEIRKIDKKKIAEHIKSGEIVKGAEPTFGTSLTIK